MTHDFISISEIKTVVPATFPAWIQLIIRCEDKNDEVIERYWFDEIFRVLGYGVISRKWESYGAYLVDDGFRPAWIAAGRLDNQAIVLHFDPPTKGALPVSGFCTDYTYEPELETEGEGDWIYREIR
jgi:hypothetical protein